MVVLCVLVVVVHNASALRRSLQPPPVLIKIVLIMWCSMMI